MYQGFIQKSNIRRHPFLFRQLRAQPPQNFKQLLFLFQNKLRFPGELHHCILIVRHRQIFIHHLPQLIRRSLCNLCHQISGKRIHRIIILVVVDKKLICNHILPAVQQNSFRQFPSLSARPGCIISMPATYYSIYCTFYHPICNSNIIHDSL